MIIYIEDDIFVLLIYVLILLKFLIYVKLSVKIRDIR